MRSPGFGVRERGDRYPSSPHRLSNHPSELKATGQGSYPSPTPHLLFFSAHCHLHQAWEELMEDKPGRGSGG